MKQNIRIRDLTIFGLSLALIFSHATSSAEEMQKQDASSNKLIDSSRHIEFARVKPIFEKRCVVCHACYDAPCQLKLSSFEGVTRGASKDRVYDGDRLTAARPSRLNIDADNVGDWRQRGFFAVIDESSVSTTEQLLDNSLLFQTLKLKRTYPLPLRSDGRLKDIFDLSLSRTQTCPDIEEFGGYAKQHPYAGMPFGLPAIDETEMKLISDWIAGGAKGSEYTPDLTSFESQIQLWEGFLNQDSNQGKLVSRYIYEHLFLGNLYFPEVGNSLFFKLVRSTTAPGESIQRIVTRRPFDAPGVDRVYYRLLPATSHRVAKTHMPYALDQQRLDRFNSLFFGFDFDVKEMPSYRAEVASNPFLTFKDIPARIRYRFMLEHAEFTIRGFMKGAVCRGQIALNVIDDHFWVVFASPDNDSLAQFNKFLLEQTSNLSLPAEAESNTEPLLNWLEFSYKQREYLAAKGRFLNSALFDNKPLDQSYIWDGDGFNRNAALTVFRHFDSASVRQGLLGNPPKTAWLIDYPILERIHYLLVAGFDVYGNIGHQLLTRMYMDFLRMESEFNFLTLLPEKTRIDTSAHWYRNADEDVIDYVYGEHADIKRNSDIKFSSNDHLTELYSIMQQYLEPVLQNSGALLANKTRLDDYNKLKTLQNIEGVSASLMPEMSVVMLDAGQSALFTILRNSAHSNISSLFDEASRRLPGEDSLTVLPGVVGAYPDAYWKLSTTQLPAFVNSVRQLKDNEDYFELMRKFGIRRSNSKFWSFSDRVHQLYRTDYPVEFGLLDYNRLENR